MRYPPWVDTAFGIDCAVRFGIQTPSILAAILNAQVMANKRRIDDFKGSKDCYIHYLESIAEECRTHHRQPSATNPSDFTWNIQPLGSTSSEQGQPSVSAPNATKRFASDTLAFSQSASKENHSKSAPRFIHYGFPVPLKASKRLCTEKLRWRQEIQELLSDVPVAKDWLDGRKKNLLHSLTDNVRVLDVLTNNPEKFPTDKVEPVTLSLTSQAQLFNCIESYAYKTKSRLAEANLQMLISRFQELVFLSFCATLVDVGVPRSAVDSAMRICVSDSGERNLETLRLGAKWVNRNIAELFKKGWGHRSTEIFLLCRLFPRVAYWKKELT